MRLAVVACAIFVSGCWSRVLLGQRDGGFAPVADLGSVAMRANRSSVLLTVPAIANARDYRVFALEPGVTIETDAQGREHVTGATIYCAGQRQRNQCDSAEVLPIHYGNTLFDFSNCVDVGVPDVPTPVMQTIQVDGAPAGKTLVIEALDRLCPFPGLYAPVHQDLAISAVDVGGLTQNIMVDGRAYSVPLWATSFPVRTEAEIRAQYGSLIFNGQAPSLPVLDPSAPTFPESPFVRLAGAAPAEDPIVLARTTLTATAITTLPDGIISTDFFDGFDDPSDQPVLVRANGIYPSIIGGATGDQGSLFQTRNFNLFRETLPSLTQFFVDRGQLHVVVSDPSQNVMVTAALYPRRPARLPEVVDRYLHISYELTHNETSRRAASLALCGADVIGGTYDGDVPRSAPLPLPTFSFDLDTARSSPLGWNCLHIAPIGSGYLEPLAGGDIPSHSDSAARVTVVDSHPAPTSEAEYNNTRVTAYAHSIGPDQDPSYPRAWLRQIDSAGRPSGVWLDDRLSNWERTRFDVYVRRDRVVVYVEGEQRLCAELGASVLTMAEVAIGWWATIDHSSAEFAGTHDNQPGSRPVTGQHQILHNTPFAFTVQYDNLGFHEDAVLPIDFDASRCFSD